MESGCLSAHLPTPSIGVTSLVEEQSSSGGHWTKPKLRLFTNCIFYWLRFDIRLILFPSFALETLFFVSFLLDALSLLVCVNLINV